MSKRVDIQTGGDPNVAMTVDNLNPFIVFGTSVPTDATAGYAKGCLFIKTNGTTGSTLYVNEGSVTSCDFNAK